jgi:hypothetical protein
MWLVSALLNPSTSASRASLLILLSAAFTWTWGRQHKHQKKGQTRRMRHQRGFSYTAGMRYQEAWVRQEKTNATGRASA